MEYELSKCWDYENGYYLTSDVSRLGKAIAHYELYKLIHELPGSIVETGVFKGTSFIRWLTYRNLLENENSRKVIGFDIFDEFPEITFDKDKKYKDSFVHDAGKSLAIENLNDVLKNKRFTNFSLIKGDILETVPKYCEDNPHLKIALLHIDTDTYEPVEITLRLMWDKIVKGGIVILDDYGVWPGETQAVDEFFADKNITIKKLPISHDRPSYIIKN
jgi:hypothetical protein